MNKRSRAVLMISPQFRPIVGGYERAAERLSAALVEAGLRVVVLTERRDRAWPAVETFDGYEVRRLYCSYRRRLHLVTSLLSYAGFLIRRGRDFDVWHVHQYGYHAALAVMLGKLLGRPVVLKLTSSGSMGIEKALGGGFNGRLLGVLHRRVGACIVTTEETRMEAVRFGLPPERIHLIPGGVDGRTFHPASPEERLAARGALGLDCERLVLWVGRLSIEKEPMILLEAWSRVEAAVRNGSLLVIVGDGPERGKVLARAGSSDFASGVHLAGNRSDVESWYRAADFYVISSDIEGLSNTMIEALASGLPVVSTDVSGSSILVAPPAAGIVVPVGGAEQLARAIETLLRDESMRAQLAAHARSKFEARFSLEMVSKRMVSLYEGLRAPRFK